MSGHSSIRHDKTCLNCRHVVEIRFCPNCGQENTDTRKTFHHLFIHFFEDLTHYENSFWKTIKHLLFWPGKLTIEYLSGRRLSYLAPVRLYIFISFLTFLLIGLLQHPDGSDRNVAKDNNTIVLAPIVLKQQDSATVNGKVVHGIPRKYRSGGYGLAMYNSQRELDSVQQSLPAGKRLTGFRYNVAKFFAHIHENLKGKDFAPRFREAFMHNMPKALFLYMPLFAFWLWLFHGKKRFYYFDHGIFTLHYFSFMLLTFSAVEVINVALDAVHDDVADTIGSTIGFALCCWWFYYFFRAHRRFYGESKFISRTKSFVLFFTNVFWITIFLTIFSLFTLWNLHPD